MSERQARSVSQERISEQVSLLRVLRPVPGMGVNFDQSSESLATRLVKRLFEETDVFVYPVGIGYGGEYPGPDIPSRKRVARTVRNQLVDMELPITMELSSQR